MRIPLPEPTKLGLDITNISLLGGVFLSILPKATAILTFIWALLRVYETDSVQKLVTFIKRHIQSLKAKDGD